MNRWIFKYTNNHAPTTDEEKNRPGNFALMKTVGGVTVHMYTFSYNKFYFQISALLPLLVLFVSTFFLLQPDETSHHYPVCLSVVGLSVGRLVYEFYDIIYNYF